MNSGSETAPLIAGKRSARRVVIVDDSRSIRAWLRHILEQDPHLVVVGEADCAQSAREVIKQTNPDVITLDIEMPGMSGLEFLEKLMRLRPMPVVMISSATRANSDATIKALSLGAMDCILKPESGFDAETGRNIARRVFSAACGQVQVMQRKVRPPSAPLIGQSSNDTPVILIGASTGGVTALEQVLGDLPANVPPVVVVQHMPGAFLVSFAKKLDRQLPQDVGLAQDGERLTPGQIRLAPCDGLHTGVIRRAGGWRCVTIAPQPQELHCPGVDPLFHSATPFAEHVIAVILTGLGRDGAASMHELRQAGAHTIGQDAASCAVYGMPRAAFDLGALQEQLPLGQIGAAIVHAVESRARPAANRGVL